MNPVSTQQWGSYIDFDETVDYLQFDASPSTRQQTTLQRFIDSACAQAQNLANRPFAPTQFKERHDGWSGEYIQLRYSPFLALVKGTEWQSTGGPVDLPESTPGSGLDGIQIDYGTSRIMRTFDGTWPKPFFPGARNIEVTYTAGFNPVPPDVWEATMELIGWKWRNTQQATRVSPFSGADEYDPEPNNGLWPGVPNRIAETFSLYRLPGIG